MNIVSGVRVQHERHTHRMHATGTRDDRQFVRFSKVHQYGLVDEAMSMFMVVGSA
jgi:hypothetical protein